MILNMRPSRVLRKLRAGEAVCTFKTNFADGRVIDIVGMTGFDCVWSCMEHVPNDLSVIQQHVWVAKMYDMDVMVRVARGSYSDYIRPLEMDATGLCVPHIMSLADAKQVVRTTRFHPIGLRPIDGGSADGKYCALDMLEYMKQANQERFLCLQIEDPDPLDDLEAIAALDGVDMLFFGAQDFSQGIGAPAQWDHPLITETRKRVAQACKKYGKFAAIGCAIDSVPEMLDMGYRFFNVAADVIAVMNCCNGVRDKFPKGKI